MIWAAAARVRESHNLVNDTEDACCVFARAVLVEAYGAEVIDRAPIDFWHLFKELAETHPWAPVEAAVKAGIAGRASLPPKAPPALVVGGWHLCQGWGDYGHTWLWFAATATTGIRVDCVAVGPPPKRPPPGPEARMWTWAEQVRPFRLGVAVAPLLPPARVRPVP